MPGQHSDPTVSSSGLVYGYDKLLGQLAPVGRRESAVQPFTQRMVTAFWQEG
jgi:hypothetical protein